MELKELIKKIIDETDLRKQYNPDVAYNLRVPEKIYQKNLKKIKFKKTSILTSCCYEFLYDDETREKCMNEINELNFSEKIKNEPVALMNISIKKKLHTKMKNEAKKIGTTTLKLYEQIWYLYLDQKINFKLLKADFLNLKSI